MGKFGERALEGRAVVVTGSGGGLGAGYARDAAARGASVVVNDVDVEGAEAVAEQIRDTGGTAVVHGADVSDWVASGELIAFCIRTFGTIDGLVNNAGIARQADAWNLDERSVRRVIEVNLIGTIYCGTHALRHMVAQGSGSIVNIVSNSQGGGRGGVSSYSASKGGIMSLTYSWALELDLAGHDVRVNAVSPWALGTGIQRDFPNPMGEVPDVSPVHLNAPLISYLLSEASREVRGKVIRLNPPELSYTAQPVPIEPILTNDDWSFDEISTAFAGPLAPE